MQNMLIYQEKTKQYSWNVHIVFDFATKSVGNAVKSVSSEY
jgi:hypothetical protein